MSVPAETGIMLGPGRLNNVRQINGSRSQDSAWQERARRKQGMKKREMNGCRRTAAAGFTAVLALVFLFARPVFAAEWQDPASSGESAGSDEPAEAFDAGEELPALFDPDLYLGIGAGTYRSAGGEAPQMMIRYYDSSGSFHGEAPGMVDYFMGTFNIIEKGRLLSDADNEDIVIRRTEDFKEVCRYRREDSPAGRVCAARDHVGLLSGDGTRLVIYDRDGKICADLETEAPDAAAAADWSERTDLVIYEPEGYLYVRLTKGEQTLLAALVGEDGSVLTSEEASFPQNLRGDSVCGYIGRNLIAADGQERYTILSPEGAVLYRDVILHWAERTGFENSYVMTGLRDKADYAALCGGETWQVLDKELAEAGTIRNTDLDRYGHLQYASGAIIGLPCEALDGILSTDVLQYLRRKVPAAKTPGGYRIADELGGFLPDPEEGWELDSFSDDFILIRNDGMQRVLRRADGQILCETEQMVFLQNNSFVVEEDYMEPDSETVIYDEDGKELYSADGRIFPCMDDWYFLHRGPWAGVVDAEGRWILRELQYDE